ncbi:hypothetical protein TNCV_3778381 [Trichonephila clavipes]|nr:hypothetical protein TNCV_3778381 [Trichonephila clavipes]
MLEKVIENWTSGLDYIRAGRGSHMPGIIFKIKPAKMKLSLQEALDLLLNLPPEISDVPTDYFSDKEVPENNLLELSLDS